MEIVFAQDQTERLDDQKIGAAGVSKNMAPATRLLNLSVPPSGNGRTAAGVDNNAIGVTKRSRHSGITIAAGHNFDVRPEFGTNPGERLPVFFRNTTGEKHAN